MEPSWTEPPPFTWVLIRVRERPACRRQSEAMALSGPERRGRIVSTCETEHVAQGRGIVRSNRGEWWTREDHNETSRDGGGRSAGTGPTMRNVPVPQ